MGDVGGESGGELRGESDKRSYLSCFTFCVRGMSSPLSLSLLTTFLARVVALVMLSMADVVRQV